MLVTKCCGFLCGFMLIVVGVCVGAEDSLPQGHVVKRARVSKASDIAEREHKGAVSGTFRDAFIAMMCATLDSLIPKPVLHIIGSYVPEMGERIPVCSFSGHDFLLPRSVPLDLTGGSCAAKLLGVDEQGVPYGIAHEWCSPELRLSGVADGALSVDLCERASLIRRRFVGYTFPASYTLKPDWVSLFTIADVLAPEHALLLPKEYGKRKWSSLSIITQLFEGYKSTARSIEDVPDRLMARSRLITDYTVSVHDVMSAIHRLCVDLAHIRARIPGKRFQQTEHNRSLFDINQLIDLYETRHRVTFMRCLEKPNLLVPVFFDAEARSLKECDQERVMLESYDGE